MMSSSRLLAAAILAFGGGYAATAALPASAAKSPCTQSAPELRNGADVSLARNVHANVDTICAAARATIVRRPATRIASLVDTLAPDTMLRLLVHLNVDTINAHTASTTAIARCAQRIDSLLQVAATAVPVTPPPLVAIVLVSPSADSLQVNATSQLTASPRDGNGAAANTAVTWSSRHPSIATVSGTGLVTAIAAGVDTIDATSVGVTGSAVIRVTALAPQVATVSVSPSVATLQVSGTTTLAATPLTAGGGTIVGLSATWSSSATGVATVNVSTGVVSAIAAGSATITATIAGVTGTATITVTTPAPTVASVTLNHHTLSFTQGTSFTETLRATVRDGSGNTIPGATVTWSSTASGVASVGSSSGVVTPGSVGTALVIGTSGAKADTCTVTVVSSTPTVAAVTVSPSSATLTAGGSTTTLSAVATTSLGVVVGGLTTTWVSTSPSVATVDASGVVTPLVAGTTTIQATIATVTGTASITVTAVAPVVATVGVSPSSASLTAGGNATTLTATARDAAGASIPGRTFAWSSTVTSVATVANGVVVPIAAGSATISATTAGISGTAAISVTAASGGGVSPPANSPAALPIDSASAAAPSVTRTVAVAAGANLQTAINAAARGDKLVLDSAGTWTGNFTLPVKSGTAANGWVTITSSGHCPAAGTRITLADSVRMPTIVTSSNVPAIATALSSSGWYLECLHVRSSAAQNFVNSGLVLFGDGSSAQNSLGLVASDLVVSHSYIHAGAGSMTKKCVALNSARSAVVDSYLDRCMVLGQDSQAIIGWNGPGPFRIQNNYLAGAGENVFFGGADPAIPNLIPCDILVRGNYITKDSTWLGQADVKNLIEIKSGCRVLIEGNVIERSWGAQNGVAVSFKSTNQSGGCPWCGTSDVTFRYNLVRFASQGIKLAAKPETFAAVPAARFLIEHNLFTDIGSYNGTANGAMVVLLGGLTNVTIRHNTMAHLASIANGFWVSMDLGSDAPGSGLSITDNLATAGGPYGIKMSATAIGTASLRAFSPGYAYANNAIIALPTSAQASFPTTQWFTAVSTVGFVNPTTLNYALASTSAGLGKGADIVTLTTLLASNTIPGATLLHPGDNVAALAAAASTGTTFLLAPGTYSNQSITPKSGQVFVGQPGAVLDGGSSTVYAFQPGSAPYPSDVRIQQLEIAHYAPPVQLGAVLAGGHTSGEGTTGWIIADANVHDNATMGIRIGHRMQLLRTHVHDNGQIGVGGIGDGTLIAGNEIDHNNSSFAFDPNFEAGGTKFVASDGLVMRGNFVHHNGGPGLWSDTDNIRTVYDSNTVSDNAREGIVHEISYDAVISNNVVQRNGLTDPSSRQWLWNAGIGVHASSNVEIYGNTVSGNLSGIVAIQQARGAGRYGTYLVQNLYVHGNTITQSTAGRPGDSNAAAGIVQDVSDQSVFTSRNNRFAANTYTLGSNTVPFAWLDANRTVAQWQGYGLDLTGIFH